MSCEDCIQSATKLVGTVKTDYVYLFKWVYLICEKYAYNYAHNMNHSRVEMPTSILFLLTIPQ